MCRGKVFSARLLSRFSYQATILLCIAQSSVSCYSAVVSIEKAEESLKAPQRCLDEGWYNSGASSAYYAMFQAVRTEPADASIIPPSIFLHHLAEAMEHRHTADYSVSPMLEMMP